jgi:hypothetical protein
MGFEENTDSDQMKAPEFLASNSEEEANNISTTVNT